MYTEEAESNDLHLLTKEYVMKQQKAALSTPNALDPLFQLNS
jgi:hypothetical protein